MFRILYILFILALSIFIPLSVFASEAISLLGNRIDFIGLDKKYQKQILNNADFEALLDSKDSRFNLLKIEAQVKALLENHGFFDALVRLSFNQQSQIYTASIDTGEQYIIDSITIDEPPSIFTPRYLIKIRKGDVFDGFKVIDAEKNIMNFLSTGECRYIKRVKHKIILNEDNHTVALIFDVGSSPSSVFGKSNFIGIKTIHHTVLDGLLDYKTGGCYSEKKINSTIKNAINTNLFNNIYYEIDPQKKNADNIAYVDVNYQTDEHKHRTYHYGVGISDTEAVIVTAGNQWRNLFQKNVSLNAQTRLSDRSQTLNFDSKYPSYFGFKKNLISAVTLGRQRFEAYDSDNISTFIGYENFAKKIDYLTYGIGVRNSFSKIKQASILSEDYLISSVPAFLLYDSKDDFLRPTLGSTLKLDTIPTINLLSANDNFLKNQITASHFINVGSIGNPQENAPTILAFRSTVGSIIGSEFNNIPIIERFYAGGAGSVRGYNYQNLGGTRLGIPQGGASLFETSMETRIGIGKNYGLTVFIDGGNVYSDIIPKPHQSLQFSAGIGGRYYSDIIPIRFDIGVPLNPRNNRNDDFGFYIGIGESF